MSTAQYRKHDQVDAPMNSMLHKMDKTVTPPIRPRPVGLIVILIRFDLRASRPFPSNDALAIPPRTSYARRADIYIVCEMSLMPI